MKCPTGWSTSWNQDCWEKYQELYICRRHHLHGRNWRGTKEPLDESERREWNIWFKLHIQRMKIMAFGPITSWQIMGKQWKQWQTLFSGTPKSLQRMTAVMKLKDACSFEGKLWHNYTIFFFKVETTLLKKFSIIKAIIFPFVMYGCDSCTIKNGEWRRTDGFELWRFTRLLRVPWTARRSIYSS